MVLPFIFVIISPDRKPPLKEKKHTVEPLHKSHFGDRTKWLLYRGGLSIVEKSMPLVEVRLYLPKGVERNSLFHL